MPYLREARDLSMRLEILRRTAAAISSAPQVAVPVVEESFEQRPPDCGMIGVGDLLLAHPLSSLNDPFFDQTIVLLTRVDSEAVEGLVLNRPLEVSVSQMMRGVGGKDDEPTPVWRQAVK